LDHGLSLRRVACNFPASGKRSLGLRTWRWTVEMGVD
jgi:hypothetical protein